MRSGLYRRQVAIGDARAAGQQSLVKEKVSMSTPRPAKTRSEGQWALGEREPLNDTEQIKHEDAPLNVRDRILNVYAKNGFDSIDKSDLRGGSAGWVFTPNVRRATTAVGPATSTSTPSVADTEPAMIVYQHDEPDVGDTRANRSKPCSRIPAKP
jgi:hypothetical protein